MENTIGKKIKKRLIDLDKSQTEIAEKIGMSPQNLNRYINGKRKNFPLGLAKLLKPHLEVSSGWFFTDSYNLD